MSSQDITLSFDDTEIHLTVEPDTGSGVDLTPVQGEAYPVTNLSMYRIASQNLEKYRVVRQMGNNGAGYPNTGVYDDAHFVLGVTVEPALAGAGVTVRLVGEIEDPNWSWQPGPLFCGPQGSLVQVPPSGTWQRQIGSALTPTKILVELRPPGVTARTILNGEGPPLDTYGNEEDFYLDTLNNRFYGPKTTTWNEGFVDLRGPMGPPGPTGTKGDSGSPAPLRMAFFVGDRPGPGEVLLRYIVMDELILETTKCRASSEVAATSETIFELLRNGEAVGQIRFPANETLGSVSFSAPMLFPDDILSVQSPIESDATLAQISFLLSWKLA